MVLLPRHLISRILLEYIPNQNKLNFETVLQQLQRHIQSFHQYSQHYPNFYHYWVDDTQIQQSLYNGYYKTPKAYILNEYRERCQLFRNLPFPTFFETKYPMRLRCVLQELQYYFRFKLRIYPDILYTPIGYYTINGYQYNHRLCLEGLKKIHNL